MERTLATQCFDYSMLLDVKMSLKALKSPRIIDLFQEIETFVENILEKIPRD